MYKMCDCFGCTCVPMWGFLMCMCAWEVCVHVCACEGVFECAYVWWLPGIPMWSQTITCGPTSSWDGQAASGGWPGGGSQWHTNWRWVGQWGGGGDTSRIFCVWRKMGGLEVFSPKNKNLPGREELGKAVMFACKYLKVCHVEELFGLPFTV